jgi:hypothetical protein
MADLKISQLTSATTPLAGTEVVPLVQSGATKKVAVSDLVSGFAASKNPTFSAYGSAVQNISTGTFTKVTLDSEDYDTNSNFASSTFTPTVAGYYQLNLKLTANAATAISRIIAEFRKNGSGAVNGRCLDITASLSNLGIFNATNIMYFNGSTDFCEIYVYLDGVGQMSVSSADRNTTFFQGSLVRTA